MNKLSIIVPVYYSQDTLRDLYDDINKKVLNTLDDYEIVMVDDGSLDASWSVINELKKIDNKIVAVKLSRNFGEHAAILAGLSVCTGDCAVTKQDDLQEDSTLILDMYNSWKFGNKVVLAARRTRQDSFLTKLFAGIYYKIVKECIDKNMPSGGCDCYLIDRQVINNLVKLGERNSSLTLQVFWLGYKREIIYFDRLARESGKGRWNISKKLKLVIDSMISFSYVPIRITWMIGLLFFVFAIAMFCSIIGEWITSGIPVVGWASLMCVVLCASGLILLILGMLGEYIWRCLEASNSRPAFVIDEIKA